MLTLVDLSAVFWPAYFGSKSGAKAYEYTMDLLLRWRDTSDRLVLCCDHPKLKRMAWDPNYKAQRAVKPEDAIEALESVQTRARALAIPVVQCQGYEADDVVATLVDQAWEPVTILGEDKDLYQLLSETVSIQGKRGLIGPNACEEKFGVPPSQMRDWLALVGDVSDNIPGCPKVGQDKATNLLTLFGDIDRIKATAKDKPHEILAVPGIGKTVLYNLQEWDPALAVLLVTLLTDAPVSLEHLWDDDAREPTADELF